MLRQVRMAWRQKMTGKEEATSITAGRFNFTFGFFYTLQFIFYIKCNFFSFLFVSFVCPNPEESNISDKRQTGDSGSHGGGKWFDFDDSDVKPISESDLEKQFMGKESAYMLFYRKKMLHRPQTGKSSHQLFLIYKSHSIR